MDIASCVYYIISEPNDLLIHPSNLSIVPLNEFLNKFGDFKVREYGLEFEKSDNIKSLRIRKSGNKLKVSLKTEFVKEFSIDLLQQTSRRNLDSLTSLLVDKTYGAQVSTKK